MDIFDAALIGSGPSGQCAAKILSSQKEKVLWIEEGYSGPQTEAFSATEILQKYRQGGQSLILSHPPVLLGQASTWGGGLSINSGLFQLPDEETYNSWGLSIDANWSWNQINQEVQEIKKWLPTEDQEQKNEITSLMNQGADRLQWRKKVIPTINRQNRQTFIENNKAQILKQTGLCLTGTHAHSLCFQKDHWKINCIQKNKLINFRARRVFLAAGALETPNLLMRSKIIPFYQKLLKYHPTVKIIAEFSHPLKLPEPSLSNVQIKQFSPNISIGASVTSKSLIWAELIKNGVRDIDVLKRFKNQALFYASTKSSPTTHLLRIPATRNPLVFSLSAKMNQEMQMAVYELIRFCFAMGAVCVHLGGQTLKKEDDKEHLILNKIPFTAIHFFSSLPIENAMSAKIDMRGRVLNTKNLFVIDASVLPDSPGVNPQACLMAFANRILKMSLAEGRGL